MKQVIVYLGRRTKKMYWFSLQMPIAGFSQMFQSKWGLNYTLVYLQGTLGSYICIKTLRGQEGVQPCIFRAKKNLTILLLYILL